MLAWTDPDREYKDQYRKFAIQNNGKPARVYLTLPSDSIEDIIQAKKIGSIDKNTFIIAVERESAKAKIIQEKLTKLKLKNYVHYGELQTLPLARILHVNNLVSVDLAFFDLCGQMTSAIVDWITHLHPSMLNAKVSWTFNTVIRYNSLFNGLNTDDYGHSIAIENWPRQDRITNALEKCPRTSFIGHTGVSDGTKFTLYSLFGALNNNWLFTFDRIHEYIDSTPMVYVETTISDWALNGNSITKHVISSTGYYSGGFINNKRLYLLLQPQPQPEPEPEPKTRPANMSPQKWAWSHDNPNGIRANKKKVQQ